MESDADPSSRAALWPRSPLPRRRADPAAERLALQWANAHRGRPAAAPAPPAGRAAQKVLRPLAKRFGAGAAEIEPHWPAIVGEALARWSTPLKLSGRSGAVTLVIAARGPAAALLEAQSGPILLRIAHYTGRKPARLKVVPGGPRAVSAHRAPRVAGTSAAGDPAPKAVEKSGQSRLEAALNTLGEAIAQGPQTPSGRRPLDR